MYIYPRATYLTPRLNRHFSDESDCYNCNNLPRSIDDMTNNIIPPHVPLQHELSSIDDAPYSTPSSGRLMQEISYNSCDYGNKEDV
jgi:hypothetical protein